MFVHFWRLIQVLKNYLGTLEVGFVLIVKLNSSWRYKFRVLGLSAKWTECQAPESQVSKGQGDWLPSGPSAKWTECQVWLGAKWSGPSAKCAVGPRSKFRNSLPC